MLPKEQLDAIAGMIGITADEFAQAYSDEKEVKLDLPEGRFLTKEKEETLLDNHGKKKYDEGKSKASKDAFDGKTKEDFLSEYKSSILEEAKIEPNKKLSEKEEQFKALQDKYQNDILAKENELQAFQSKMRQIENNNKIEGILPELREDISKTDARTLFNATHEVKEDGIYRAGKLLTDDIQNPLGLEQAVANFIKEKNWAKIEAKGHGGKPTVTSTGKPKSYAEFQKYCQTKGWSEASQEARQYLSEVRKDNPDFNMD